jgi:hypothetical protein
LYDIDNYLFLIFFIALLTYCNVIKYNVGFLLAISCFLPFMLNDVLFPASYMNDQFRYTEAVQGIRSHFSSGKEIGTVRNASWLLAAVPIPFVASVKSLGFANKFIYVAGFAYLIARRHVQGPIFWFLMLYPSLLLYTALSLRDTLILLFMISSTIMIIDRRWVFAGLLILPLFAIKFQNAAVMGIIAILYPMHIRAKGRHSEAIALGVFAAGFLALLVISSFYLDLLNLYRIAMAAEDGTRPSDIMQITGTADLLVTSLTSAPYFLLKPLPWETNNLLQLVQSVENIIVAAFLGWLSRACWKINAPKALFWLSALLFACAIYGLVVANFGTAARYRFPFLTMYVIAISLDCGLIAQWAQIRSDRQLRASSQ